MSYWEVHGISIAMVLIILAGLYRGIKSVRRAASALGLGTVPGPPRVGQTVVIVPVAGVSRLTQRAISEALSISHEVIAVTVVADSSGPGSRRASLLNEQWARWSLGVPLRVCTEYASVARPVAAFIDDSRARRHDPVSPVITQASLRQQCAQETAAGSAGTGTTCSGAR